MDTYLSGFAAESKMLQAIKNNTRIKFWLLPASAELLKVAQSSPLGRRRLAMAQSYFEKEYGVAVRNSKSGQVSWSYSWDDVPPSEILDRVYSVDCVVSLLGYVVAIDITVDSAAIYSKQSKLTALKPLLRQLGIDSVGVFYADDSWDNIWDRIKAIAKSEEVAIV
jgi:hypothetical protein